jgi:NDP-sugar pyrophosphorylase family protein
LLKDFLKSIDKNRVNMLGVLRSATSSYNLPVADVEVNRTEEGDEGIFYSCFFHPDCIRLKGSRIEDVETILKSQAKRHITKTREITMDMRLPSIGQRQYIMKFPISSSVAAHIEHWIHILRLNHLAFGILWLEYIYSHIGATATKVLSALKGGIPSSHHEILKEMNVIEEDAEIHRSAYVESSFIGRGAKIGAGALVRNSFIGENAVIGDGATVLNCTISENSFISDATAIIFSTVYPDSSVSNVKIQMSLIGRNTFIHQWCSFLDARFVGDVMVQHKGEMVSSGSPFLGSVIGHNCTMAGKVLIMPGRTIPNNTTMVMRPDETIWDIPDNLPQGVPLVRDRGTLVPLSSLKGEKR